MNQLITPQSLKLLEAISKAGGEARFVGGCVRDTLIGKKINDVDLATNLNPEQTTKALEAAGLKVIPTGIDHGTVTAIVDDEKFEVTTLRLDVATDGRHATVKFTDDWQADAARRDFTYNALYMDASGQVYDYFGGQEDLKNGDTVFIGKAEDRINEDYLRILRFFRFRGRYKIERQPGYDPAVLATIRKLAPNLTKLSYERIWSEVQKILLLNEPQLEFLSIPMGSILPVNFNNSDDTDDDDNIGQNWQYNRLYAYLANISKLERRIKDANPVRRLAVVLPDNADIAALAETWKFSRKEAQILQNVFNKEIGKALEVKVNKMPSERNLDIASYKFGVDAVKDFLVVFAAKHGRTWLKAFKHLDNYHGYTFPLSGADLIELGVVPGKDMGALLRRTEDWWLSHYMAPSHVDCVAFVQKQRSYNG